MRTAIPLATGILCAAGCAVSSVYDEPSTPLACDYVVVRALGVTEPSSLGFSAADAALDLEGALVTDDGATVDHRFTAETPVEEVELREGDAGCPAGRQLRFTLRKASSFASDAGEVDDVSVALAFADATGEVQAPFGDDEAHTSWNEAMATHLEQSYGHPPEAMTFTPRLSGAPWNEVKGSGRIEARYTDDRDNVVQTTAFAW